MYMYMYMYMYVQCMKIQFGDAVLLLHTSHANEDTVCLPT